MRHMQALLAAGILGRTFLSSLHISQCSTLYRVVPRSRLWTYRDHGSRLLHRSWVFSTSLPLSLLNRTPNIGWMRSSTITRHKVTSYRYSQLMAKACASVSHNTNCERHLCTPTRLMILLPCISLSTSS